MPQLVSAGAFDVRLRHRPLLVPSRGNVAAALADACSPQEGTPSPKLHSYFLITAVVLHQLPAPAGKGQPTAPACHLDSELTQPSCQSAPEWRPAR